MDNRPYLSAIFPVCGAADHLPLLLIDADRRLKESGYGYEIIVVFSGSIDDAPESIKKLLPVIGFRLMGSPLGGGERIGLSKSGLNEARGRYRLLCAESDGAEMTELLKLVRFLEDNPEERCVIGRRSGISFNEFLFSGFHKIIIPELRDPKSPFMCVTAESAEILSRISPSRSSLHFIASAREKGIKFSEISLAIKCRPEKKRIKAIREIWDSIQVKTGNFFERILGRLGNSFGKMSKKSYSDNLAEEGKDQI